MEKIRLFVGLKIPDTTATTAFHTLKRMGFEKLKKVERELFYEFVVLKEENSFMEEIVNVDILVNANKNYARVFKEEGITDTGTVNVLVKNTGDKCNALFTTLRERLGFVHVNEISRGTFWKLHIDAQKEEAKQIAEDIARQLLCNEHFQEYSISGG